MNPYEVFNSSENISPQLWLTSCSVISPIIIEEFVRYQEKIDDFVFDLFPDLSAQLKLQISSMLQDPGIDFTETLFSVFVSLGYNNNNINDFISSQKLIELEEENSRLKDLIASLREINNDQNELLEAVAEGESPIIRGLEFEVIEKEDRISRLLNECIRLNNISNIRLLELINVTRLNKINEFISNLTDDSLRNQMIQLRVDCINQGRDYDSQKVLVLFEYIDSISPGFAHLPTSFDQGEIMLTGQESVSEEDGISFSFQLIASIKSQFKKRLLGFDIASLSTEVVDYSTIEKMEMWITNPRIAESKNIRFTEQESLIVFPFLEALKSSLELPANLSTITDRGDETKELVGDIVSSRLREACRKIYTNYIIQTNIRAFPVIVGNNMEDYSDDDKIKLIELTILNYSREFLNFIESEDSSYVPKIPISHIFIMEGSPSVLKQFSGILNLIYQLTNITLENIKDDMRKEIYKKFEELSDDF